MMSPDEKRAALEAALERGGDELVKAHTDATTNKKMYDAAFEDAAALEGFGALIFGMSVEAVTTQNSEMLRKAINAAVIYGAYCMRMHLALDSCCAVRDAESVLREIESDSEDAP